MTVFHLTAVIAVLVTLSVAEECPIDQLECVFNFTIEHKLTMMHGRDLVFPENGNIYKYDVTNTSDAIPISVGDVITADGWEEPRLVAVVNGKLPGPDIIVYEGQKVTVYVQNLLSSHGVTIHWHGLPMKHTPWMDGVPYVTQCPIMPHQTFKYQFTAEPKGTFWWHSHVGTQRTVGVFGAFIIKSRTETFTEDRIMQILDWNHDSDSDVWNVKFNTGIYANRKPVSLFYSQDGSILGSFVMQSGLINGKGRFYDPISGRHNGAPLHVFDVSASKKYRFRVIGTGLYFPFRVSVDNHTLTLVASDGYDLQPVEGESFVIYPGERFDFEIAADKPVGNYWVRAVTLEKPNPHVAEAILRYAGAPTVEPTTSRQECTQANPCIVHNCPFIYYPEPFTMCKTFNDLKALAHDDPAPKYVEGKFSEHFLNFARPGIPPLIPPAVNGKVFHTPDVNLLTQSREWYSPCEAPVCGDDRYCKCTHILDIGNNDTVQLVLTNMGNGKGGSHPVHLHGHSFYVLKMGFGEYDMTTGRIGEDNQDIDCRGGTTRDKSFCNDGTWSDESWKNANVPDLELDRPPRKDTIIVPTGGYVVIRIRANNPGLWNFHCHLQLHNVNGMQMLLNESFGEIPQAPAGFPECYSYPPSTYRLEKERPASVDLNDTQTQDKSDKEQIGDDYMKKQHFDALLGLLIASLALQVTCVIGIAICCILHKGHGSSSKYNFGHTNAAFGGK